MPGMQKTGCIFFLPRKVKKGFPIADNFLCLPTPICPSKFVQMYSFSVETSGLPAPFFFFVLPKIILMVKILTKIMCLRGNNDDPLFNKIF